ncbi:MAG: metal ABC transporter permease, partial [Actinomycetota bacterium]
IAIVSKVGSFTRNFEAALFGNVLGVTGLDLAVVAAVFVPIAAIVFRYYRSLLFVTFDPEVAEASGVPTGRLDALFSLMIAATIVVTMNILGVLLVAATLVIPPVIARMLTNSFGRMLKLSVLIGALCSLVGVYVSYFLDISSGPSVVLTSTALFLVVYALTGSRGRRRLPAGAVD